MAQSVAVVTAMVTVACRSVGVAAAMLIVTLSDVEQSPPSSSLPSVLP